MQPAAKPYPELAAPDVNAGSREIRVERRIELWLDGARLREPGCHSAPVRLHDLSPRGFRTEWPYLIDRGKRVWLKLPGFEAWPALVAWNRSFELGCTFEVPLHAAVFDRIIRAHMAQ